ncbi:hypothetical protein [Streptomyces acidiscabies]|uniref:Uncharacterized protein n=1 Tax=Streptomyces acidiscabies TaxID=42234 RepID=A0ABU4MBK1_9ACTN|nr:hypothetical protein [Streptomyces acidiscabies]MDX3024927.1 hypothetical protein [Streptomyces acidiscabies]
MTSTTLIAIDPFTSPSPHASRHVPSLWERSPWLLGCLTTYFRQIIVMTGEQMSVPFLGTHHHWHVGFGETPPPTMLDHFDVVRVSIGLGLHAIDTMLDSGHRVGPLLCCSMHRLLLIPVESGASDRWHAPHSTASHGPSLRCRSQELQPLCHRVWLIPPGQRAAPTATAAVLHTTLSLVCAHVRASRQPDVPRLQQTCRV